MSGVFIFGEVKNSSDGEISYYSGEIRYCSGEIRNIHEVCIWI